MKINLIDLLSYSVETNPRKQTRFSLPLFKLQEFQSLKVWFPEETTSARKTTTSCYIPSWLYCQSLTILSLLQSRQKATHKKPICSCLHIHTVVNKTFLLCWISLWLDQNADRKGEEKCK